MLSLHAALSRALIFISKMRRAVRNVVGTIVPKFRRPFAFDFETAPKLLQLRGRGRLPKIANNAAGRQRSQGVFGGKLTKNRGHNKATITVPRCAF